MWSTVSGRGTPWLSGSSRLSSPDRMVRLPIRMLGRDFENSPETQCEREENTDVDQNNNRWKKEEGGRDKRKREVREIRRKRDMKSRHTK